MLCFHLISKEAPMEKARLIFKTKFSAIAEH